MSQKAQYECSAMKKDKSQCTKPGTEIYENKYYCKVHYRSISNTDNLEAKNERRIYQIN